MSALVITLITATSALIAGIAGPIVSITVARRQIRATVVSNNRERWIEALRDALAEYVAVVAGAALLRQHSDEDPRALMSADREFRASAERMLLLKSKILMMTSPTAEGDRELRESIEALYAAVVSRETLALSEWRARLDVVTAAGHNLLTTTWARVKHGD